MTESEIRGSVSSWQIWLRPQVLPEDHPHSTQDVVRMTGFPVTRIKYVLGKKCSGDNDPLVHPIGVLRHHIKTNFYSDADLAILQRLSELIGTGNDIRKAVNSLREQRLAEQTLNRDNAGDSQSGHL